MEEVWRSVPRDGTFSPWTALLAPARHVAQRGTMRQKTARGKMRHWHGFCRRLQFVYIHVLTTREKHAQESRKNTLTTHAKRAQEL